MIKKCEIDLILHEWDHTIKKSNSFFQMPHDCLKIYPIAFENNEKRNLQITFLCVVELELSEN
jgi:hypothetical protein